MNDIQVEICCGDIASVVAAHAGGAERIELCSGLLEGGITPSIGMIKAAVAMGIPLVNILIRPRSGDFLYTPEETEMMEQDIREAIAAGANGIVIGALDAEGNIDIPLCTRLVKAARSASVRHINVTFHRAFDLCKNPGQALEEIIALGCDCILTSGMTQNAVRGIPMLAQLVRLAGDRILIMAGAGVTPANAADLIAATGVGAVHSTARRPRASKMRFRRPNVTMGAQGADEYSHLTTSPDVVAALLKSAKKN